MAGTMRPAAFWASSMRSIVSAGDILSSSHLPGSRDQLLCPLDDRRVNHLRSQANHTKAALLRIVESRDDLQRFVDLHLRRCEGLVDHANLAGMNAAHALEAERARGFCPTPQAIHVSHIAKHRIDSLNTSGPRSVHQACAGVE